MDHRDIEIKTDRKLKQIASRVSDMCEVSDIAVSKLQDQTVQLNHINAVQQRSNKVATITRKAIRKFNCMGDCWMCYACINQINVDNVVEPVSEPEYKAEYRASDQPTYAEPIDNIAYMMNHIYANAIESNKQLKQQQKSIDQLDNGITTGQTLLNHNNNQIGKSLLAV